MRLTFYQTWCKMLMEYISTWVFWNDSHLQQCAWWSCAIDSRRSLDRASLWVMQVSIQYLSRRVNSHRELPGSVKGMPLFVGQLWRWWLSAHAGKSPPDSPFFCQWNMSRQVLEEEFLLLQWVPGRRLWKKYCLYRLKIATFVYSTYP